MSDASSVFVEPTKERLNTMSSTSEARINIRIPSAKEDEAITAAALSDPDALPLSAQQLNAMVPVRNLRGRPPSERKKLLISVRYSPEVIEYFKSTGEGWQSRMDSVLRQFVFEQTHSAVPPPTIPP
jgi:uncharacterized protein (DUF4415 family)